MEGEYEESIHRLCNEFNAQELNGEEWYLAFLNYRNKNFDRIRREVRRDMNLEIRNNNVLLKGYSGIVGRLDRLKDKLIKFKDRKRLGDLISDLRIIF